MSTAGEEIEMEKKKSDDKNQEGDDSHAEASKTTVDPVICEETLVPYIYRTLAVELACMGIDMPLRLKEAKSVNEPYSKTERYSNGELVYKGRPMQCQRADDAYHREQRDDVEERARMETIKDEDASSDHSVARLDEEDGDVIMTV